MAQASNILTVFVFNHRFEQNIAKLEQLYGSRFSNRRFIMPFYRGDRSDVLPVYESSHLFQGYFAQAARALIDPQYTHYLFIADDLFLNPELNEHNILSALGAEGETAYIKGLEPLCDVSAQWTHGLSALQSLHRSAAYVSPTELPDAAEAARRGERFGFHFDRPITLGHLRAFGFWYNRPSGWRQRKLLLLRWLIYYARNRFSIRLPYPMVVGYADFILVPAKHIRDFCHLCGVFAAMGTFVEVGLATALMLSCDRISTEPASSRHGIELWTPEDVRRVEDAAGFDTARLFDVVGKDALYVHPVKLSKWKLTNP